MTLMNVPSNGTVSEEDVVTWLDAVFHLHHGMVVQFGQKMIIGDDLEW